MDNYDRIQGENMERVQESAMHVFGNQLTILATDFFISWIISRIISIKVIDTFSSFIPIGIALTNCNPNGKILLKKELHMTPLVVRSFSTTNFIHVIGLLRN